MRQWASFVLAMVIAMTPAAREALSEITGAEIYSGTIDLQDDQQFIEAVGRKDGVLVQITCRWWAGRPAWINYTKLESEL